MVKIIKYFCLPIFIVLYNSLIARTEELTRSTIDSNLLNYYPVYNDSPYFDVFFYLS
jgi:hypothetical protein